MTEQAPIRLINARLIDPASGYDGPGAIRFEKGVIKDVHYGTGELGGGDDVSVDSEGKIVAPGLVDLRTFVGEPGSEYRETLQSASRAAATGGVTTFLCMPNTQPVIDDAALVDFIIRRARDTAITNVLPAAAITKNMAGDTLTEFGLLTEAGAVAFTEGRHHLQSAQMMKNALTYAKNFDALIINQPLEHSLAVSGVMNAGEIATYLGLKGIPKQAESIALERDIQLAQLTGGLYHAAQISCDLSLHALERAKQSHTNITCGVSINNLALSELDIGAYRTFFKLSPPLRSMDDRAAMIKGIKDGTIDVIVSAHDPQDVEAKRHPFAQAEDGAVGLETWLGAALRLVHDGSVDIMTLIRAMTLNPAQLLGLDAGRLAQGAPADVVMFDIDRPWQVKEEHLKSQSRNTPFELAQFTGQVSQTYCAGVKIYDAGEHD